MSASTPVTRPRRLLRAATLTFTGLLVIAGCDTGDGTTLRDPTAPTTLPPPETTLPGDTLPGDTIPGDTALGDSLGETGAASDPVFETVPASTGTGSASNRVPPSSGAIELTMPWAEGAAVDLRYTCDGSNVAPAMTWTGIPDGTVELAVAMVNESDVTVGRPFIQWVMTGLDPSLDGLGEGEVPPGAVQGINFFGDVGYTGPCPDPGTTNDYTFTVYAVEQQLELADETPAAQMLDVIGTVAIDSASSSSPVTR